MTFNTGNPIGSTDARDLSDNAENFDKALGTLDATWTDRLGVTRDSFEGRLAKGSFYRVGDFTTGYTLTNMRQTLEYNGHEYSWAGTFPKVVAAGATPATSGGIGAGAWVDRTDVTLRSELISGYHPELLPYENRTITAHLSDSVHIEDYRDGVRTDTQILTAAHDALPASGGTIHLKQGVVYFVDGFVNTKMFFALKGKAEIKSPPNASSNPVIYSAVVGANVEFHDVYVNGDKANQTSLTKHNVYIKNAASVYLSHAKSRYGVRNGWFFEDCDRVDAVQSFGNFCGFAVSAGDDNDVIAAGINTLRCDNVSIFGGDYSLNSYIGVRGAGDEATLNAATVWAAATSYAIGASVKQVTVYGYVPVCTTAGTSGGTTPTWPSTLGGTVTDGTVVWTMKDPLARDFTCVAVTADGQFGNYGTYFWGLGFSVATTSRVKFIGCKARDNMGNNFDTNRVFGAELIGCDGIGSKMSMGYNPDYSSDVCTLAGGGIKVIGGNYSRNAGVGIGAAFSYQGNVRTYGFGDMIVDGAVIENNSGAGISVETGNNVKLLNNTLKNNGTTTQIAILEASDIGDGTHDLTYQWGTLTIDGNSFSDTRADTADYDVWFGIYSNAAHPRYGKMVVDQPAITRNNFRGAGTSSLYSSVTQGGYQWFNNALIENNIGLSSVINGFTASRLTAENRFDITNLKSAIIVPASSMTLKGFDGGKVGDRLMLYFANGFTTIYDKDHASGTGGNIQLTSNTSLVPASGSLYEFVYMGGYWNQM